MSPWRVGVLAVKTAVEMLLNGIMRGADDCVNYLKHVDGLRFNLSVLPTSPLLLSLLLGHSMMTLSLHLLSVLWWVLRDLIVLRSIAYANSRT